MVILIFQTYFGTTQVKSIAEKLLKLDLTECYTLEIL